MKRSGQYILFYYILLSSSRREDFTKWRSNKCDMMAPNNYSHRLGVLVWQWVEWGATAMSVKLHWML